MPNLKHASHSLLMSESEQPGPPMSRETRGAAIKQRRLDLGIKSHHDLWKLSGIDRQAISNAEKGVGSNQTLDRLEAFFRGYEEETGHDDPEPGAPLRVVMRDVYGMGEIIVEGPVDHPDELVEAVGRLLSEIRNRSQGT